jgi:type I restriction enzyme R subunit
MTNAVEQSSNFSFLRHADPLLAQLAASAERYCLPDPNAALLKLRQFGEVVGQHLAAVYGIEAPDGAGQADILGQLQRRRLIDADVAELLHLLRKEGNAGVHRFAVQPREAVGALRIARQLGIWFHRAFRRPAATFRPGPFVEPVLVDYLAMADSQQRELARLATELAAARDALVAEKAQRADVELRAALTAEEKSLWQQLAQDEELERQRLQLAFDTQLVQARVEAESQPKQAATKLAETVAVATQGIALDEAETRALIDAQLRAAGWEAETSTLRFTAGTRPQAGRNMAIAEWPTAAGPADYVLFRGLMPLAVVEAKKFGTDVASVIEQAERYSLGYQFGDGDTVTAPANAASPFGGWLAAQATATGATHYRIPFVYASNGRAYHRQFLSKSGVWFRDIRQLHHHAAALAGWHTPEGLSQLFELDISSAEEALAAEPYGYLNLRDYQVRAVQAIEQNVAAGKRQCLVAMATGTGKTRTVIGLIYRMLKAKRFRRILFLVDRNSLGVQAQDAFKEMRLEQDKLFTEIYDVMELEGVTPDTKTSVQVATVQGMVHRLFSDEGEAIPIDRYDCVVVDEAHRGYTLDREMGEGELEFRSEADYVSAYRRVLDQFDAVKVALTATPAQHTTQIFGLPVYTYTYREAVVDGWLIDHDPPVRLVTRLAKEGIHFDKGVAVDVFVPTGKVEQQVLPDELDFEIDSFNRLVITEKFNRVVCEALAEELDPFGEGKTLVFCANDAHADLVVTELKRALEAAHGFINDKTVLKITGRADRPAKLLRLYKNEKLPNIAVTVDLLTTGIDVPEICNLVFLRRVRSRILYEQMLGRATRLCPEIGKQVFRIFDAVDIYKVRDVTVPLAQLFTELTAEAQAIVTGTQPDGKTRRTHADDLAAQIVVRVRNLVRRADFLAGTVDGVSERLKALEVVIGIAPKTLSDALRAFDSTALMAYISARPALLPALENLQLGRVGIEQVISTHDDELAEKASGYGVYERPEEYLDAFKRFISDNLNKIAALELAVTRPRDLTREDLRQLQVTLAQHQFTDRIIHAAWKQTRSEDIAATLIGYIRQLAIGSPLVPFAIRVDKGLQRLLASQAWTVQQRRWLERIAKSVKEQVVVDETSFSVGAYANHGGFRVVNTVFDGKAMDVIRSLDDAIWEDADSKQSRRRS